MSYSVPYGYIWYPNTGTTYWISISQAVATYWIVDKLEQNREAIAKERDSQANGSKC